MNETTNETRAWRGQLQACRDLCFSGMTVDQVLRHNQHADGCRGRLWLRLVAVVAVSFRQVIHWQADLDPGTDPLLAI